MNNSLRGVLTWAGIAGGALTIASHWSNSLKLTNNVQWLLEHWGMLLRKLWMFLGDIFAVEFDTKFALALSLIFFYLIVSATCAGKSDMSKLHYRPDNDDIRDLTLAIPVIAIVFFGSTIAALLSKYYTIFVVLDNIFVCLAFIYIVEGGIKEKLIGGISYAVVYTVLDDYLKSTMSPDNDAGAAVLAQMISILVVFVPLLFVSNKLLTRRISQMFFAAGVIVGLGGALKLSGDLRAHASS
jgi:hypothetical protein